MSLWQLKGYTEFQMSRNDMSCEFKLGETVVSNQKKKKKNADTLLDLSTPTELSFHFFEPNQCWNWIGLGVISLSEPRVSQAITLGPQCAHGWFLQQCSSSCCNKHDLEGFTQLMTTFKFFCYFEPGVLDQAGLKSTGFFQLPLFGICNSKIECHRTQLAGTVLKPESSATGTIKFLDRKSNLIILKTRGELRVGRSKRRRGQLWK